MKISILKGLLLIDMLSALLVLIVILVPSSIIRAVLGLPFLLFCPGYVLMIALFRRKEGMGSIEILAFSIVMSLAIVGLFGFGLNYTVWGISLQSMVFLIAIFILVMSVVAIIRRSRLPETSNINIRNFINSFKWQGSKISKALTAFLIVSILVATGILGYTVTATNGDDRYTEFYILGNDGKVENYPVEFVMNNKTVINVKYQGVEQLVSSNLGLVTLGIINHEQQKMAYSVKFKIDGEMININYGGDYLGVLGPIELNKEEKWEQRIGFAPQHVGANQKFEIILIKNGDISKDTMLNLWINVGSE